MQHSISQKTGENGSYLLSISFSEHRRPSKHGEFLDFEECALTGCQRIFQGQLIAFGAQTTNNAKRQIRKIRFFAKRLASKNIGEMNFNEWQSCSGKRITLAIDPFVDIIGRNFKQPPEGLGWDNTPSSWMWRTIINPARPL